MSKKNKISVNILGQEHYLISTDHPDYVHKVAKIVDERMGAILRSNSSLSPTKIGVLTALNLADDLTKTRQQNDNLKHSTETPKFELLETKQQVLEMTKQITESENLYTTVLHEFETMKQRRAEQEKMITDLTSKLEHMFSDAANNDEVLKKAKAQVQLLEEKVNLRESEIAEYIKVFDEIEAENLKPSQNEETIIYEGDISDN